MAKKHREKFDCIFLANKDTAVECNRLKAHQDVFLIIVLVQIW